MPWLNFEALQPGLREQLTSTDGRDAARSQATALASLLQNRKHLEGEVGVKPQLQNGLSWSVRNLDIGIADSSAAGRSHPLRASTSAGAFKQIGQVGGITGGRLQAPTRRSHSTFTKRAASEKLVPGVLGHLRRLCVPSGQNPPRLRCLPL